MSPILALASHCNAIAPVRFDRGVYIKPMQLNRKEINTPRVFDKSKPITSLDQLFAQVMSLSPTYINAHVSFLDFARPPFIPSRCHLFLLVAIYSFSLPFIPSRFHLFLLFAIYSFSLPFIPSRFHLFLLVSIYSIFPSLKSLDSVLDQHISAPLRNNAPRI